ncbi:hypothetical protein ANO11243_031600 [Dothideomycetidae sp. 11243]|nr:hypothetical protein ANO11243_031600 [fungal sp. No.11243]
MTSTSFDPGWQWPENLPGRWTPDAPSSTDTNAGQADHSQAGHKRRHYGPRQCRICLEVVQPTFETPSEDLPEMLQGMPSVSYASEDVGRLIRPCLCKGSQKYVHEGCLTAWRLQDPNRKRNYWECPTCKYNYRLTRMTWAHWVGSTATQVALTFSIFLLVVFLLGYVADPIINIILGTQSVVSDPWSDPMSLYEDDDEIDGWTQHFLKGIASLGLLGAAKYVMNMNFLANLVFRSRGIGNFGGTAPTGRNRLRGIGWAAVVVGILTFLWTVWKAVRSWTKKTLTRASERVMDVPLADDDDDDNNDDG